MYRWCVGSANGLRIRRRLINEEKLQQAPQAILVANHLSSLDILVLGSFLRRDYRWLAKSSLFKVPFSGWYLRIAGHIPVYRSADPRKRNRVINERIKGAVSQGASLLFFPEGTRSDTGKLRPFRLGAFLASVREEIPILPLVVRGTHELMEKGAKDLAIRSDRECSVTVLDPIVIEPLESETETEFADRLRQHCYEAFEIELLHQSSEQAAS